MGVKIYGDQHAKAGNIIIRQNGVSYTAGNGAAVSKNSSIYALVDGKVSFKVVMKRKFTGALKKTRIVSVLPVVVEKPVAKKKAVKATVAAE